MRRLKVWRWWLTCVACGMSLLGVVLLAAGCEDSGRDPAEDLLNERSQDDRWAPFENPEPSLSPTEVTLSAIGDQVVLTASGGVGPYQWSVRDSSRGRIEVRGWSQALYTRTGDGDNTVRIWDQGGHVAVTHISQSEEDDDDDDDDEGDDD